MPVNVPLVTKVFWEISPILIPGVLPKTQYSNRVANLENLIYGVLYWKGSTGKISNHQAQRNKKIPYSQVGQGMPKPILQWVNAPAWEPSLD